MIAAELNTRLSQLLGREIDVATADKNITKMLNDHIKMYQCMDCGCVDVKNIAEQKDAPKDSKVSRCKSCGAWQFDALPCHTCLLIGAYGANV